MPSGGAAGGIGGGSATGGAAGVGADGMGNVGPFPMGVGLGSGRRNKTWDKWSELSAAGKGGFWAAVKGIRGLNETSVPLVGRVTRQTGNLTVSGSGRERDHASQR